MTGIVNKNKIRAAVVIILSASFFVLSSFAMTNTARATNGALTVSQRENLMELSVIFSDYWTNPPFANETLRIYDLSYVKALNFYRRLLNEFPSGVAIGSRPPSQTHYTDDFLGWFELSEEETQSAFSNLLAFYLQNQTFLEPLLFQAIQQVEPTEAFEILDAFLITFDWINDPEGHPPYPYGGYRGDGDFRVKTTSLDYSTTWRGFDLEGFWKRRVADGTASETYRILVALRDKVSEDNFHLYLTEGHRSFCRGAITMPDINLAPTFLDAREQLVNFGWQPFDFTNSDNYWVWPELLEMGITEAEACSGTGWGYCRMAYSLDGAGLWIITIGATDLGIYDYGVNCNDD